MPLTPPVTVFYHAGCSDGFGAAFAAWSHFGDTATYRPLSHGEDWSFAEIAGHRVYILDFSYPPATLKALAALASSVTQIDHHVSAYLPWAEKLEIEQSGLAHHTDCDGRLNIIFDLQKSGARLAWEYFRPGQPLPIALQHIEDQDLWRFAMPGTRAFCRALRLHPFDFQIWKGLIDSTPSTDTKHYLDLLAKGEAIEAFFRIEVERLANGALPCLAYLRGDPVDAMQALRHGQKVLTEGTHSWLAVAGSAVNADVLFASELGNRLAEKNGTFGLVWQLSGDGEIKVSLRSKGDFDVSEIAARYGGGGHRNAAGFRIGVTQFFSEIIVATQISKPGN